MGLLQKIRTITSKLAFRVICGIIILLLVSSTITAYIGYYAFTDSFTREYTDSAYRTAVSAAEFIDGNQIDYYLENSETLEYQIIWNDLNSLCQNQDVTLIYVIKPNTDDYGWFVSVFNTVNDDSGYTPWVPGYQRDTTNDEYRQIYKAMYEDGLEAATVARTENLNGRMPHLTSLIPIKDDDGNTTALLCVERPMSELHYGRQMYINNVIYATIIFTVIACVIAGVFIKTQLVAHFKKISEKAKNFAYSENRELDTSLRDMSRITEIKELGNSVEKMENDTLQYMRELSIAVAERERVNAELTMASSIQSDALPSKFPPFPDRNDFDIYASMTPAREVGGDFYDFFFIDDDHLALVIADVSGKGMASALFMMMAKILIKFHAMSGASPTDVIGSLNNDICKDNEHDMFITVWFGILECSTGNIVCVNAGHEHPAVRRKDGQFELIKGKNNFVVGGIPDIVYKEYELHIDNGDMMFLYTDGVSEATDCDNNAYGLERLIDALNMTPNLTPESLIRDVRASIKEFVGNSPQFDDITMLSIKR